MRSCSQLDALVIVLFIEGCVCPGPGGCESRPGRPGSSACDAHTRSSPGGCGGLVQDPFAAAESRAVTVASDSERCPNNRLSLSLTRDTAVTVTVQVLTRDTERPFEY